MFCSAGEFYGFWLISKLIVIDKLHHSVTTQTSPQTFRHKILKCCCCLRHKLWPPKPHYKWAPVQVRTVTFTVMRKSFKYTRNLFFLLSFPVNYFFTSFLWPPGTTPAFQLGITGLKRQGLSTQGITLIYSLMVVYLQLSLSSLLFFVDLSL